MTLRLNGSTSGYVEIDAPATAGSNTLVLPTGNGSANQILKNGGSAGSLAFGTATEDSSGNFAFNSGYGSVATTYGVRAWVNFDGTSGSIGSGRANGNCSSITDQGTGYYQFNFSNAMPDANYCAVGSVIGSSNTDSTDAFVNAGINAANAAHGTTFFRFCTPHRTAGNLDYNQVQVAVIR